MNYSEKWPTKNPSYDKDFRLMGSTCSLVRVVFSYTQVSLLLEVNNKGKCMECLPNACQREARGSQCCRFISWPQGCSVSSARFECEANRTATRTKWHNECSTQRGSRKYLELSKQQSQWLLRSWLATQTILFPVDWVHQALVTSCVCYWSLIFSRSCC